MVAKYLVTALISIASVSANPVLRPRVVSGEDILESYDYVVVGGGTSGNVVANRLTEDPKTSVLIIETGPLDGGSEFITIPYNAGSLRGAGSKYDYNITSPAQDSSNGRIVSVPNGRVLGGSSAINGMMFPRGSAADYDAMEELENPGWGFEGLYPYFRKSETFTPPPKAQVAELKIPYEMSAHGTTGYIQSSYPRFTWPQQENFFRAMNSLGHPTAKDQGNGGSLGVVWSPNSENPKDQSRSYARNYYDDAVKRPNYHALLETTVTKLITSKNPKGGVRVDAVEFAASANSTRKTVKVKKEAILAAGGIFTPQVLQVSGIGPTGLLKSLGIDVVLDLPGVGANLNGHIYHPVNHDLLNVNLSPKNLSTNASYYAEMYDLYRKKREGPLTSAGGSAVSFLPYKTFSKRFSSVLSSTASNAHLEANIHPDVAKGYEVQRQILAKRLATDKMAAAEMIWSNEGSVYCSVMHPFSRGYVAIRSKDIFTLPIVNPRYLSNPADVDVMVDTVKYLRKIMKTPAMQELGAVETAPGAKEDTDEQITNYIRNSPGYFFHTSGTSTMMPKELGGVVDPSLRVYGTLNLRIVDAGVMALVPASHTQTSVYAIAEKAADIIRDGKLSE